MAGRAEAREARCGWDGMKPGHGVATAALEVLIIAYCLVISMDAATALTPTLPNGAQRGEGADLNVWKGHIFIHYQ